MTVKLRLVEPGERPVIQLKPNLKDLVDEAVAALASDTEIFHRGGSLVRIVRSGPPSFEKGIVRPEGSPTIRAVASATLRERLSLVARFEKFDVRKAVWVHTLPSDPIVLAVAARGEWPGLRPLIGVTEAPLLRADGTILQTPGYDEQSAYYYLPSQEFPRVPDEPSQEDAILARDELLEVVCDFPFASEAHRSAWLAFLLTLFARPAIDGPVPLGAIDATTRGTGKGKLADATAIIALGREAAKVPQPEDDTECRKFITALVDEGEVFALFDNATRPISFPSLDAALTAGVWKDRILGSNRTICAPMRISWAVTGNNLELGGDASRRTLHQRLESPLENPEDRGDFKHDLIKWVRAERPRLAVAALTILRAYAAAGRPDMKVKPWGSFESWSALIANCVVWVKMADPQFTRATLEDNADAAKRALAVLMDGWARLDPGGGMSAKSALAALYPSRRWDESAEPDGHDDTREAIEQLCPGPPGKPPTAVKLGVALRGVRRRVIGGRMFDSPQGGGHNHVLKWMVVSGRSTH